MKRDGAGSALAALTSVGDLGRDLKEDVIADVSRFCCHCVHEEVFSEKQGAALRF